MKGKKMLALIMAATMLLSSVLVGCGSKTSQPTDGKTQTEKGEAKKDKVQELNLVFLEPKTLDTNKMAYNTDAIAILETQESLFRTKNIDGKDEIVKAGCTDYKVSDDKLTYTFTLRENTWSDGKPVIAQHYVDSAIRFLTKKNAFRARGFGFALKNGQAYYLGKAKAEDVGVKAVDDKTLVYTLENPDQFFINKLALGHMGPIRLDVIEKGGKDFDKDPKKLVYCGPYIVKEWEKEQSLVFEKNPKFWDAKNVTIEKVTMTRIEETSTSVQMFENKQLDLMGGAQEHLEKWKKLASEGKWQFREGPSPDVTYFVINQKDGGLSGLMGNAKVRKALSLAIDRQEFLDTLIKRYYPAYGLIPNGIFCGKDGKVEYRKEYKSPLEEEYAKYKNDPAKLQALLKEGLKELGKPTDNLKDIKVTYLTSGADTRSKAQQEYWKQRFEKMLGITLVLDVKGDTNTYYEAHDNGKYDICYGGWGADFNDPINFLEIFGSSHPSNDGKFNNAEYDKFLKELENEYDATKRYEIYKKMEKILVYDEVGCIPYYYKDFRTFKHNYLKDFMQPTFGPNYEWRWAYVSGKEE